MRISSKIMFDTARLNLSNLTEDMNRANMVVAAQSNILRLSDDPVGLTQSLGMKSSLKSIDQLGRNISLGRSWVTASESALTSIQNIVSDTKALCVQMASANVGASERRSAAETVQNNLEEIVGLANTQIDGRYIFAGSKTDEAAFTLNGDNSVTYNGNSNAFSVKVSKDATVEIGVGGQGVFQPSGAGASDDIFVVMKDLATALQGNDISGIQSAMSNLDTYFDHTSTQMAEAGSKMTRLDTKDYILQDLEISLKETVSNIEDPDMAEAIMNLQSKQLAYQAALSATAKVMQLSIVNFM